MNLIDRQQALALGKGLRLHWEPLQARHVLLYPGGIIELNPSAGWVLELLDGQRSVAMIIDRLAQRFPGVPGLDEDVLAFLEVARAKAWIE
ncbi:MULTISPECIES: pyrroloquinoline quinone biosynthesis peptide chaperone PqqD [Pseudomonas]|uniref:pyrroloquinoline quinone biosynthesis peptide chaperone PqqD n=1 Tax=Pseudomonas TaxID=286 RepID=UPI00224B12A9|nr:MULTISPECIES: pyrroloquinoline quinone biosynthesis peptide chaperone PqqD [unclassified Pseudomonas]MCX2887964.1 pyrroloquinoline quinone biosynthesis peptide chaperone PqqD [Pseudomonas sp. DCB_BI]MDH4551827.1 pyrroloquinoline quinone biosynthesis peptide chaperone PqqD [Pseudomonas sp. BN607]